MIGKALPSLLVFLSQSTVFLLVAQLVVSDSFCRFVPHALFGSYLVSSGGDWARTAAFVIRQDHAASAARVFFAGDATDALVRGLYVSAQHAESYAGLRFD